MENMAQTEIIEKTRKHVESMFRGETNAHDWWHIYRVWRLSLHLAEQEPGADLQVVQLAALLHDIADWKFHEGDLEAGPRAAQELLEGFGADDEVVKKVAYIVRNVSFRGGTNQHKMQTLEGKIVQDADRLDAIGAIGIARTFAFGGSNDRIMHDPGHDPKQFKSFEEYRNTVKNGTTINHFYEKLLLIKDRLNTDSARLMAERRHKFMQEFLNEFYAEWEGER